MRVLTTQRPILWIAIGSCCAFTYADSTATTRDNASSHDSPAAWLGWGGPRSDFRVEDAKGLTETFGQSGPKYLWRRKLGDGYAAILFQNHRLYTHYHADGKEVVVAIDAHEGTTIWQHEYVSDQYDDMELYFGKGPNATPLILENRLYSISIAGELRCLELDKGTLVWRLDLHARYGRQKRKEEYGFSASPMSYDGRLLVFLGGDQHGVVALDPKDGRHLWGSPSSRVSYAPPALMGIEGRDQLVFFSPTEAIGMDPQHGNYLWRYPVKCVTENNLTTALHLGERYLWLASQLDGGTRVLELPTLGSKEKPKVLWESTRLKQAHWHSFCVGDYVYGSMGGNYTSFLTAVNWRTGKVAWKYRGFHLAKGVFADGKLYFVDENGQLAIARLSPHAIEILDAHQVTERVSWTPPTLAGSRLFLRDRKRIVAIELAATAYELRE